MQINAPYGTNGPHTLSAATTKVCYRLTRRRVDTQFYIMVKQCTGRIGSAPGCQCKRQVCGAAVPECARIRVLKYMHLIHTDNGQNQRRN